MAQDQSSSNSNVRRCGVVGEGEGEDVEMSLMDAVGEMDRLEEDANAVLGGSDAYNCTYPQGYLKRQAVYACATCTPQGNAGICLACSYACHEGHDLYELYTKRNFKCDCGNEKFGGNVCQLYKDKKQLNSRNRYGQNFRGLYCSCCRPYPDEDDSVEDEMIQCIICEDWYHGRHLGTEVPDNSDYHEMICTGCMSKYSFLWAYQVQCALATSVVRDTREEEEDVNVEHTTSNESNSTDNKSQPNVSANGGTYIEQSKNECLASQGENVNPEAPTESTSLPSSPSKRKIQANETEGAESPPKKKIKTGDSPRSEMHEEKDSKKLNDSECLLEALQERVVDQPDCSTFWSEGWRSKLCQCCQCKEMYEDRNLEFLIDEEDTMQAYEAKGHEAREQAAADDEAGASTFASMGRVQQIEMVQGVTDFMSELNGFLKSFAEEGKVVKESDVREFFEQLNERKRNRMQFPQHNCR